MYYVYVLKSGEDKYIGYTSDIEKRITGHNHGDTQTTRGKKWELVYYEAYKSKKDAQERERKLKRHGNGKRHLFERIKESLK